ncbi:hypothetical protein A0J48_025715, partial [Sphaerospermopsis aphanizomenoides BCCUSP55]|uniref:hypothetical protein n=1 Tax=Sphaerospermopsis aphanizomenoides TaxID=459663 RepID=UPI0019089BEA
THNIVGTFLSIDLSLLGLNYYFLGHILKKKNILNKLQKAGNSILIVITILAFLIVLFLAKNNNVWYTGNSVVAYFTSFLGGAVGCMMIITLSLLLEKILGNLKLVTYISANTILILGFHFYSNKFANFILSFLTFMPSISKKLLVATLSILILIPVIMLTNKFVPQIGGRKAIKPIKIQFYS